jgi:hypothetical protein
MSSLASIATLPKIETRTLFDFVQDKQMTAEDIEIYLILLIKEIVVVERSRLCSVSMGS